MSASNAKSAHTVTCTDRNITAHANERVQGDNAIRRSLHFTAWLASKMTEVEDRYEEELGPTVNLL